MGGGCVVVLSGVALILFWVSMGVIDDVCTLSNVVGEAGVDAGDCGTGLERAVDISRVITGAMRRVCFMK